MKRSRDNVPEKIPDIVVKRLTARKIKRQVASSTVSKAPATALLDIHSLLNMTGESDPNRIMTDTTPIEFFELRGGSWSFQSRGCTASFWPSWILKKHRVVPRRKKLKKFRQQDYIVRDEKTEIVLILMFFKHNTKTKLNFKYKSNKLQFSFLNEVLDLAEEANELLKMWI